ncbi:unnamed protein product, partial [Didymodactylos carnosus]
MAPKGNSSSGKKGSTTTKRNNGGSSKRSRSSSADSNGSSRSLRIQKLKRAAAKIATHVLVKGDNGNYYTLDQKSSLNDGDMRPIVLLQPRLPSIHSFWGTKASEPVSKMEIKINGSQAADEHLPNIGDLMNANMSSDERIKQGRKVLSAIVNRQSDSKKPASTTPLSSSRKSLPSTNTDLLPRTPPASNKATSSLSSVKLPSPHTDRQVTIGKNEKLPTKSTITIGDDQQSDDDEYQEEDQKVLNAEKSFSVVKKYNRLLAEYNTLRQSYNRLSEMFSDLKQSTIKKPPIEVQQWIINMGKLWSHPPIVTSASLVPIARKLGFAEGKQKDLLKLKGVSIADSARKILRSLYPRDALADMNAKKLPSHYRQAVHEFIRLMHPDEYQPPGTVNEYINNLFRTEKRDKSKS